MPIYLLPDQAWSLLGHARWALKTIDSFCYDSVKDHSWKEWEKESEREWLGGFLSSGPFSLSCTDPFWIYPDVPSRTVFFLLHPNSRSLLLALLSQIRKFTDFIQSLPPVVYYYPTRSHPANDDKPSEGECETMMTEVLKMSTRDMLADCSVGRQLSTIVEKLDSLEGGLGEGLFWLGSSSAGGASFV